MQVTKVPATITACIISYLSLCICIYVGVVCGGKYALSMQG